MKEYEVLYDWPLIEIAKLTSAGPAEDFVEGLAEASARRLVTIIEGLQGLAEMFASAKAGGRHFERWAEAGSLVATLESEFGGFPGACFRKLRVSIMIAQHLAANADPPVGDVDESRYEIRAIAALPLVWFCSEASSYLLAVFAASDMSALERAFGAMHSSPRLLWQLLAALHSLPDIPAGHAALVPRLGGVDAVAMEAFVRLSMLASGAAIHSAPDYVRPVAHSNVVELEPGVAYHQWNEVHYVLSEYNSRRDPLLKYLTIYHVIENFMFRLPLVKLEAQQPGGAMFTIRHFRRLYQEIDQREGEAVKQLFQSLSDDVSRTGVRFGQRWVDDWRAAVPPNSHPVVDAALAALGQRPATSQFANRDAAAGSLARLVYAVRNAVVHNKETEFHLTYASLDAGFIVLIQSFLIPTLEELCFFAISKHNPALWYNTQMLSLY